MGSDLGIWVDRELDDTFRNPYRLSKTKLVDGIRKYCELRKILPSALEDDPPDAEGADVIVQLALFGEVVYG